MGLKADAAHAEARRARRAGERRRVRTTGPAPRRAAGRAAPAARPGRLDEILAGDRAARAEPARARRCGRSQIPDFAAVYRAAGIVDPPHGFSAFKVLEILRLRELAALEPKAKAAALAGFLKMNPAGPVPIADVMQDAVRRDQALDKFEEFLRAQAGERAREIERETRRCRPRSTSSRAATASGWRRTARRSDERAASASRPGRPRKRIEERSSVDAVAPFVERNPVSLRRRRRRPASRTPSRFARGDRGMFGRLARVLKSWLGFFISFAEDPEVMLQESIEEMRNTLPRLNQILVTTRATVIRLEQEHKELERQGEALSPRSRPRCARAAPRRAASPRTTPRTLQQVRQELQATREQLDRGTQRVRERAAHGRRHQGEAARPRSSRRAGRSRSPRRPR